MHRYFLYHLYHGSCDVETKCVPSESEEMMRTSRMSQSHLKNKTIRQELKRRTHIIGHTQQDDGMPQPGDTRSMTNMSEEPSNQRLPHHINGGIWQLLCNPTTAK